jgi:flagellin
LTGIQASANTAGTELYLRSVEFGSDAFISIDVLDGDFDTASGATATNLDHGVDGTVIINGATATVNGLKAKVNSGSINIEMTLSETFAQQTTTPASFQITGGGALFAIAPQVGLAGQESIGIRSIGTTSLGSDLTGRLSTLASGQTNDLRSRNFSVGQRIVREAIDQVSSLRGRIGAFQKDTLDTTINSLLVTNENITAAESAIRDADFAVETSAMTRAQILVNSSMLVLQSANQQPATILQLLGG